MERDIQAELQSGKKNNIHYPILMNYLRVTIVNSIKNVIDPIKILKLNKEQSMHLKHFLTRA